MEKSKDIIIAELSQLLVDTTSMHDWDSGVPKTVVDRMANIPNPTVQNHLTNLRKRFKGRFPVPNRRRIG